MKIKEFIKSKRIINIVILLVIFTFYILIYKFKIYMPCIFKSITGYSCPACGLSRGVYQLFNFNILKAIKYNILSIPMFIFIITTIIFVLIDIFRDKDSYIKNIMKFFEKRYILIFILLIFVGVINNINKI